LIKTRDPARQRLSPMTLACLLGLLVVFIALVGLAWPLLALWLEGLSSVQLGFLASLAAGLMTAVGALPVFIIRRLSQATEDALMGFGAGVMLAATAFELIAPAIELAAERHDGVSMVIAVLVIGVGLGGAVILAMYRLIPNENYRLGLSERADALKARRIHLLIFALALHNLPEGLAVGVGFGGDLRDGITLAIGIGLQNMPEGMIVAVGMLVLGYRRMTAFLVALLTGLIQPVGGLIGAVAVGFSELMLPWGLAFAAGAMLFVISHEIIPASHRHGHAARATGGLFIGFLALLVIDVVIA
jgi:zinc transporter, ZIP family